MTARSQAEFVAAQVEKEIATSQLRRELTILERWGIDAEYLTKVVNENPSLRGMLVGYIAERKLWDVLKSDQRVTELRKDDDHDRTKKGDLVVTYRGFDFKFEVKSLQTNSVKFLAAEDVLVPLILKERDPSRKGKIHYRRNPVFDGLSHEARLSGRYKGHVQCDASDRRTVKLAGGGKVETTCLLVGEFDILAAGLFSFREQWDFGFALNRELPTSTYGKYSPKVRKQLLATLLPLQWPLSKPFVKDPFALLDRLVAERRRTKS